jgi:hypothetical protein
MMRSLLAQLLLCAPAAVFAGRKAQFLSVDGDILLKLDYATHRGVYNKTNEVKFHIAAFFAH